MLKIEMCRHGQFLFRHRTYLPLVLVPFGIWQILQYDRYVGGSHDFDRIWDWACFALALIGVAVRFISAGYAQSGTSGRNAKSGQIADALNRRGMYSLCRHPLYLGNLIMYTAILLFTKSPWFALAGALALFIYYERIIATEEDYLFGKFGSAYTDWSATTPCLFPKLTGWQKAGIAFSVRAGLRSEFYSVAAVVVSMYILDIVEHYAVEKTWRADTEWNILLVSALAIYFILRFLRKNTSLLDEPGPRVEAQA